MTLHPCPIRRCLNWFTFATVWLSGCEMGELLVHNRQIRLIRHFNPLAYSEFVFVRLTGFVKGNFSLRFLMWQAKGGNHKGLPPLEFSPFGKPLSLTPLLRLRWRKSAVLACRPRIAALAQAPCSRKTVCGLQRLTAQTFYSFKLSSL